MIAEVTALLAGHLGAGGLIVTAVLCLGNRMPASFVRFCVGWAAGLAILAALLGEGPVRFSWLGVAGVGALWYASTRGEARAPRWLPPAAIVFGIASLTAFAALSRHPLPWLGVAGSLSSALLLGAVTVTMVLGHWYLVDTSLSIAPLREGALWLWLAVAARITVVAVILTLGGWEVLRVHRAADFVFSTNGLFFLFRTLTGLAAPALLAGLIWQTVKIRSTQSATGLLYVALVLVLFGELVSQFLLVATGYPL